MTLYISKNSINNIKQIAYLMNDLKDHIALCTSCGMCQSVCPLFEITKHEADIARGKLSIIQGLMHKMFNDPKGSYERINRCLLCGSCAAACPRNVNTIEIFIKAKEILTRYIGLSPIQKIVFKQLIVRPVLFNHTLNFLGKICKLLSTRYNPVLDTSCAKIISPFIGKRKIKQFAKIPFHKTQNTFINSFKKTDSNKIKVAFFTGCLIDNIFIDIAKASIKALIYNGIKVIIPQNQGCCGMPAIASGDMETFEKLILYHLEIFNPKEYDYIVTACATCTSTIKKIWPIAFNQQDIDIRKKINNISSKTMDINQFLVNKIGIRADYNNLDQGTKITYHDPCHLKKSLGIFNEPRILIKSNPDYKFTEMEEPDKCCGLGGSFNINHYDLSLKIGAKKFELIDKSQCSVLATSCPACMLQFADIISKAGKDIIIKHPVEIYSETLK